MEAITNRAVSSVREVAGVRLLERLDDVPAEVSRLRGYGVDVGFDLETTSTDPINDKIITITFKPKGKIAAVIDVRHWTASDLRTLGTMLEPLFDGTIELITQNGKFDLEFFLAQLGIGAHKVYDCMLAEQVILGLGVSSATAKNLHLDLASIGKRYGVEVHKEERNWFIGLDTRVEGQVLSQVGSHQVCITHYIGDDGTEIDASDIDKWLPGEYERVEDCQDAADFAMAGGTRPWDEPLPEEQLQYIRQDVSVVHPIKEKQMALIKAGGLVEAFELEMRALFAVVGIEHYGVTINKDGWLAVIDRVQVQQDALERTLHMGHQAEGEQFDGLDIHILKVRNERYDEKMRPYDEWVKSRDLFINTKHKEWDDGPGQTKGGVLFIPGREEPFKMWADYKKYLLEWWYERHAKLTKPPALKSGINFGSWMQVRDGFNDLGIPVKGVSEDELEPFRGKHPLVGVYIEYGHARKLTTVYGREKGKKKRAFVEMLDEHNRLRASYQQIGADTQRMSSFDPNLQQIPDKGMGSELRKNVIPAPGFVFVDADFSNIELRIVAESSRDPFLLEAFASGRDVHAYTAGMMFGLKDEEITEEWTKAHDAVVGGRVLQGTSYRKVAKTVNYSLLYGAGIANLAITLGTSQADARMLRKLYYETFAVAVAWLNEQKSHLDQAKKRGESRVASVTRAGWTRWFDIPKVPEHPAHGMPITVQQQQEWQEAMEEYRSQLARIKLQLANTPIQGLSAAITKLMAALWHERVGYDEEMRLVALIHDEGLVEVIAKRAQEAAGILREVMYEAMRTYLHVVDLGKIEPTIGSYWGH